MYRDWLCGFFHCSFSGLFAAVSPHGHSSLSFSFPMGETVFIQNVILPYRFHSLWGERSSYRMSFFLIVFFLNAVEVEVNGFDVRAFQKVYTV